MKTDKTVKLKIDKFFADYDLQKVKSGQVLMQPGDEPTHITYLVDGHIRKYDISAQGDKVVVNVFQNPAYLPMAWALNKSVNEYYYEAITDVEVRKAPVDKTLEFIKSNPDVTLDLLRRIYAGVDVVLRRMAHAMGGTARTRILYEILLDANRFGERLPDGHVKIPMRVYDLAARTGLTRETASRELGKLKDLGLSNGRGFIEIESVQTVEQELGSNL